MEENQKYIYATTHKIEELLKDSLLNLIPLAPNLDSIARMPTRVVVVIIRQSALSWNSFRDAKEPVIQWMTDNHYL